MHAALPALEARLRDLDAQMANRDELATYDGGDALERTEAMVRRELRSDVIRMADRERIEVMAAIQRVKDGTYGVCEECGEEISAARLRARLCATLCRNCQEEAELRAKDEDEPLAA